MKPVLSIARLLPIAVVITIAAGYSSPAAGQPAESAKKGDHGSHGQMGEAEMQKMMELATPGEHHKDMNAFVGKWKTSMKMYMGPGEPTASTGSCSCEWMLGGRYLMSKHTGEFGGMPFEGTGIDGYDNAQKRFFSIWFDNMGTGVMMLTGQSTSDGKGVTYSGTSFDCMQMKDVPVREEVRWTGEKSYTFTMYMGMPGPDGTSQEMKVMEMTAEKQ